MKLKMDDLALDVKGLIGNFFPYTVDLHLFGTGGKINERWNHFSISLMIVLGSKHL